MPEHTFAVETPDSSNKNAQEHNPRAGLRLCSELRDRAAFAAAARPSGARTGAAPEDLRATCRPPASLGAPEPARLAMDAASARARSLPGHALELGQGWTGTQFPGYAALSSLAQNGLIRACVETVADDMTRNWIEIKRRGCGSAAGRRHGRAFGSEADSASRAAPAPWNAAAPEALAAAVEACGLRELFHHAAELSGYFGGCLLLIDTGVSGEALSTPLDRTGKSAELTRPGGLRGFRVIEPINAAPGDYDAADPLSPHYLTPAWWWLLGRRVHASRLIRVSADEPPALLRPGYNFFGIPQAQILWDYVLHFQECRAAAARLLTRFSLTVFKTRMDDVLFRAGGTRELDARIRYLVDDRNNDGVLAIDKDSEDVIKVDTSLSGVTDIVRQSLELLAAVNRTPAVKLLGISPSGFNATGESDIRNYHDHILSRQEKIFRAPLRQALEIVQIARFGEIDPGLTFDFAPLNRGDDAARAAVRKTRAETAAVYLDREVLSREDVRAALAADPDFAQVAE